MKRVTHIMPTAHINGTELYYVTQGQGQPILFMHGGLGADHAYFLPFFEQLTDDYQLIYYDHRGNGRSQVDSLEGVTHATWADDADALREHLGYEKIILLGHSYGGFLAQEYAIRYSDHLQGLVLLCTAPELNYLDVIIDNAKKRTNDSDILSAVEDIFSTTPVPDDSAFEDILNRLSPLYFYDYDQHKKKLEDNTNERIYTANAWNYSYANCWKVFNVVPELKTMTAPTLVVSGADDWITPVKEGGQRIHDALPNSEFVIFEESGHYPYIEEDESFFQILRDWLAKL